MTAGSQWHRTERQVLKLAGHTTARCAWVSWQQATDRDEIELWRSIFTACCERVR